MTMFWKEIVENGLDFPSFDLPRIANGKSKGMIILAESIVLILIMQEREEIAETKQTMTEHETKTRSFFLFNQMKISLEFLWTRKRTFFFKLFFRKLSKDLFNSSIGIDGVNCSSIFFFTESKSINRTEKKERIFS